MRVIACEEAETTVRHFLNNLNIGANEGEPRQTTQRNIWTLWEIAADYRTEGAAAIRKWVFDRYKEYDTPEAQKNRQHVEQARERAEKRREAWSKVAYGVVGLLLGTIALAIVSHANVIFGSAGGIK